MGNIWGYILNATIYGSITGVVILLIKNLLKNRINKKYAYLLWMILIIKLAFPFGPESSLSLFNKIPVKINSQVDRNTVNMPNISEGINYTVGENYESGSSENLAHENVTNSSSSSTINVESEKSIFKSIIPIIWISGLILTLTTYIIIYLHFIKNIRKKENYKCDYLENILKECKEKLHIKRKINLVVDDMINSPSLVGAFKTRIIIPSNLVDLSIEELQHIFLHELCHFKSKDTYVDNILVVLQCIHWFNPLVWYLFKHVRNDMEMACDERVLSVLNEKEHNKYGLTMLTVLEKVNRNKRLIIGLNMTDDKKTIKKRVELIKNSKYFTRRKRIFAVTGITCLFVLCGVLLTNGKVINKEDNTVLLATEKADLQDLNQAISKAIVDNYIKDWNGVDFSGELNVESHVILGKKENDDSVEVYVMATYGHYSFENDIFSIKTSRYKIQIRIKFSKVKEGQFLTTKAGYYYLESEEANDGEDYKDSVLKMFPKKEAHEALNGNYTDKLLNDVNNQAQSYVKSIGRECKVTTEYVEKEYIDELAMANRADMEGLWNYPEWIGTKEELVDKKRYIYETQYDKSSKILTFIKYNEDKEELERMQYKISGKRLEKIDGENLQLYSGDMVPVFIDNEDFKITVKNISIINNNAEYGLYIENKSNKTMEISLDKIHIGDLAKIVEFKTKLKAKENKYSNLKIKDISKLEYLNDKIYGEFLANSKEYYFIFK
ncbi:M56 family metallopeptidase [Terrisporobacter glycolicus]|uniref:M56 family metallopeptidase n=1 Tax=Terrisporobacter glycolicus TaxID=36841 RepID=UPI003464C937